MIACAVLTSDDLSPLFVLVLSSKLATTVLRKHFFFSSSSRERRRSAVKAAATYSSCRRRHSRRRRRQSKRYRDGHRTTAHALPHKNDAFFPRDEKTKRIEFKTPSTPPQPKTTRRSSFCAPLFLFVVVRSTNVVIKVVLRVLVRADDSLPERRGRCRNHHHKNVSRGMAVYLVRDRTENEQSETIFFTPRSRGYFERQRFRSASKKCV